MNLTVDGGISSNELNVCHSLRFIVLIDPSKDRA